MKRGELRKLFLLGPRLGEYSPPVLRAYLIEVWDNRGVQEAHAYLHYDALAALKNWYGKRKWGTVDSHVVAGTNWLVRMRLSVRDTGEVVFDQSPIVRDVDAAMKMLQAALAEKTTLKESYCFL